MNNIIEELNCGGLSANLYHRTELCNGQYQIALGAVQARREFEQDALLELLSLAAERARACGADQLIAPLDGDTWHSYRTKISGPNYFLQPQSLLSPASLQKSGFSMIAEYASAIIDLTGSKQAISRQRQSSEISYRILDINSEIKAIYDLCCLSFSNNYLYTVIDMPSFARLYAPLAPTIEPQLIWGAMSESRLVGLLFALPDQLNRKQIILKTIAVDPAYGSQGIATNLMERVLSTALNLGYKTAIQALYKIDNRSASLSAHLRPAELSRYGLFALSLKDQVLR